MKDFTFKALSLFDADVVASETLDSMLHHSPSVVPQLARSERFALWFKAALTREGLMVRGPRYGEDGCGTIDVPATADLTLCIISGPDDISSSFSVLVTQIGAASQHVEPIVERILRMAPEVSSLSIA